MVRTAAATGCGAAGGCIAKRAIVESRLRALPGTHDDVESAGRLHTYLQSIKAAPGAIPHYRSDTRSRDVGPPSALAGAHRKSSRPRPPDNTGHDPRLCHLDVRDLAAQMTDRRASSATAPKIPPAPPPPPLKQKQRSYFERFVAQPLTTAYGARSPSVQTSRPEGGPPNPLVPKLPGYVGILFPSHPASQQRAECLHLLYAPLAAVRHHACAVFVLLVFRSRLSSSLFQSCLPVLFSFTKNHVPAFAQATRMMRATRQASTYPPWTSTANAHMQSSLGRRS